MQNFPRVFISTPVANYSPDWAIVFDKEKVSHIYFVAETKGSDSDMDLREIEKLKIHCARSLNGSMNSNLFSVPLLLLKRTSKSKHHCSTFPISIRKWISVVGSLSYG
jgi:restriction endonuclease